jgi:hypothetical protein
MVLFPFYLKHMVLPCQVFLKTNNNLNLPNHACKAFDIVGLVSMRLPLNPFPDLVLGAAIFVCR